MKRCWVSSSILLVEQVKATEELVKHTLVCTASRKLFLTAQETPDHWAEPGYVKEKDI